MVSYFPNLVSRKAIYCYFITLAVISVVFMDHALPLIWVLFGSVEVILFFVFSNRITKRWGMLQQKVFMKRLFWTSLSIRLIYMVFAYFFYEYMTGIPFMFHSADEQSYYAMSGLWLERGFEALRDEMQWYDFSDSGEIYWSALLCLLFGHFIMTVRIAHCLLGAATCVLIYRIARRHFEDSTARMAAVFCMLMPNLIYYCGIHLKEVDMVFLVILLVDSVDVLLNAKKIDWRYLVLAVLSLIALFTFRTALGVVGLLSILLAVVLNKGKLTSVWKRIGLALLVMGAISFTTLGNRLWEEVNNLWNEGSDNQAIGMEYRAQRIGGNVLARNASGVMFAPAIFTLPFASMVYTEGQENQQMLNGGCFVKNVMSGFTILAVAMLLFSGKWRKHTLLLSLMIGYLIVIAFSNFAHSERFHQPALPFELMFAAYGISQLKRKHVKWIDYWMVLVLLANMGWAWIKLAGRGTL